MLKEIRELSAKHASVQEQVFTYQGSVASPVVWVRTENEVTSGG